VRRCERLGRSRGTLCGVSSGRSFEELVGEAETAPIDGWDFTWLEGRATEARPPWGYARSLVTRIEDSSSLLDVQTGGAEVLCEALGRARRRPMTISATDAWPPNVAIARRNLAPLDGGVFEVANDADLPFASASFDLVTARHPVVVRWDEIGRVLASGGTYFAQHVGPGSNRELTNFVMGPQAVSTARSGARAVSEASAAGLHLVDIQQASLRVAFGDIGAVVYFLRKVPWTVPAFSVATYQDRLRALHDHIVSEGQFVSYSTRFLIQLQKPKR
jgi:SAM-dependent methyltransferase